MALVVKSPPANAGDIRDMGSIPGSGRSPGGGHGNPLQILPGESPWTVEPGGLQFTGSQSRTRPKRLSVHPLLLIFQNDKMHLNTWCVLYNTHSSLMLQKLSDLPGHPEISSARLSVGPAGRGSILVCFLVHSSSHRKQTRDFIFQQLPELRQHFPLGPLLCSLEILGWCDYPFGCWRLHGW